MIQMPPNNNEYPKVANTNNEVTLNLNTITNSGSSSNQSLLLVPTAITNSFTTTVTTATSSSSSFSTSPSITNLINPELVSTSYFNQQASIFGSNPIENLLSSSSSNSPNSIESDEFDLNMDDMMRNVIVADNSALDDMVFDSASFNDLKTFGASASNSASQPLIGVDINTMPTPVHMSTPFTIKQENTYCHNDEDTGNTNSSSFSGSSINDKLNSTTNNAQVTTVVTNRNGKSVVEKRFGPITVRPRRNPAPTLSSGRRSKYIELTPDEEAKREMRRQRNRQAAEKCKQKRNEIETQLESQLKEMQEMKRILDSQIDTLEAEKKELEMRFKRHVDYSCCAAAATTAPAQFASTSYHTNTNGQQQQVYYYPNSAANCAQPLRADYAYTSGQYSAAAAMSYPQTTPAAPTTTMTNLLFMQPNQQQQSNHYQSQTNWG